MGWLILWFVLALGTQIWLSFRVGRSSVALAIVTFFVGFPGAIYTLLKHRSDKETTVTVPFVVNVVFCALFFVSVWQTLLPRLEALNKEQEVEQAAPATAPAPSQASVSASSEPAAPAVPAAASSIEPPLAAPGPDAIDGFSAALRAVGLAHTVTRVAASASLPAGVTDAALFSVKPLALSAVASAASAAAGTELSATVFKCESAQACRNLAGTYMQQAGPQKRRVLQNGLLMLSMPLAAPADTDLTPAAVASAFRKL